MVACAETDDSSGSRSGGFPVGLVLGGLVGAALALFIAQNTQEAEVNWLFLDASAPLWIVLVVTVVVSLVLAQLVGGAIRRARRR